MIDWIVVLVALAALVGVVAWLRKEGRAARRRAQLTDASHGRHVQDFYLTRGLMTDDAEREGTPP